ncbi:MAG: hypothetical protein H2057_05185 [Alphaproteobacteria bacterium]|nr:hypothetical protein [Alphaproteobacteria bacterium]
MKNILHWIFCISFFATPVFGSTQDEDNKQECKQGTSIYMPGDEEDYEAHWRVLEAMFEDLIASSQRNRTHALE